jgi:hypothetical protein
MIIQIVLIAGFLMFLFRFLANPSSYQHKAWTKILTIIFALAAIVVVLFPDSSNTVAHWVGVTRGADLLLYLLTLSFIFTVFNMYIKEKQDQKRLVTLARKVALLDAQLRQKPSK